MSELQSILPCCLGNCQAACTAQTTCMAQAALHSRQPHAVTAFISPPWDALQASALLGVQQAAPQPRRPQALPAAQPATRLLAEPPPSPPAQPIDVL